MLTVKDFRNLAISVSEEEFDKRVGPFVLIQRPPRSDETKPWEVGAGTKIAHPDQISNGVLTLLFEFEKLCVATLPPLQGFDELVVGRLPDCDLRIDAPSVSKRHASLKWDAEKKHCKVMDIGSTNGTFVDGCAIDGEAVVHDGDIVSFGDEHYWYLLSDALYRILKSSAAKKFRSKTG